jgi:MFS family permease
LIGIGIAGLGTSVSAPTIIGMAGAWAGPDKRAGAISTVTTIAYLGFLIGPAAVGAASSAWSLPAALGGVAVLAVLVRGAGAGRRTRGERAGKLMTCKGYQRGTIWRILVSPTGRE